MKLKECYRKMQANCGIKKGDIVKVLRTFKTSELGSNASWLEHKNLIGQMFKVKDISESGRSFVLDIPTSPGYEEYNLFPFFVLELVKKAEPVIEITVKINGVTRKLSDISQKTLLNIRNKT